LSRSASEYVVGANLVEMIKEHANDMHDLLVAHEGKPMLKAKV
jgi:hypothetical protein